MLEAFVQPIGRPISHSTNCGFSFGLPFVVADPAACCASPGLLVLPPSENGVIAFELVTLQFALGVDQSSPMFVVPCGAFHRFATSSSPKLAPPRWLPLVGR